MNATPELSYRIRGRAAGVMPGAHRSRHTGGHGIFLDQVPYLRQPNPRRIDLRLTLRDPFENVYVRRFEERLAITLYALVDLSRSMRFEGIGRKFSLAGQLCTALAHSARKSGDMFGIVGYDTTVRDDFLIPASRRNGLELEVQSRFDAFVPERAGAGGLLEATRYVAGRRKLVFLCSDFQMPLPFIEKALGLLSQHDVVPIVLNDSAETQDLPAWGLIELEDLETRGRRTVFMRPRLRRRWMERAAARRAQLHEIFLRFGRSPIEVKDQFDPEQLSRRLLEG